MFKLCFTVVFSFTPFPVPLPAVGAPVNTRADSFWNISPFIFLACHVSRGQIAAVSHTQYLTQSTEFGAHPPRRFCSPDRAPPFMASSVLSVKVNYTFTPERSLPRSNNRTSTTDFHHWSATKLKLFLISFGYSIKMILVIQVIYFTEIFFYFLWLKKSWNEKTHAVAVP